MQRLSSSSSISMAVVVRKIITGPSTWYSSVTSLPVRRIFAGRRDRELPFALQELERIARLLRAFLFADREHLVLERGALHVEQRSTRHRRVPHAFFFGHEREHRIHECRLARGRGALHDDGERLVELARDRSQVRHQLVRPLADKAATIEVRDDAIDEPRIAVQLERFAFVVAGDDDGRFLLRLERSLDRLLLQDLELPSYLRDVGAQDLFLHAHFGRRLLDELRPLTRRDEIDRVDEVDALARDAQHDLHLFEGQVLFEAADAIAAIAECEVDRVAPRDERCRDRWRRLHVRTSS